MAALVRSREGIFDPGDCILILKICPVGSVLLSTDIDGFIRLLSPQVLDAYWQIAPIRSKDGRYEWLEATGDGCDEFEALADGAGRVTTKQLLGLLENTQQIIWAQLSAFLPDRCDNFWVSIRVIDSSFYEIVSADDAALNRVRSGCSNAQFVDALSE